MLAPSAAFYAGLAHFGLQEYKEAKTMFEFVLDNSSDPSLDKRAEEYIEKIIQIEAAAKIASKKWLIGAQVGLNYDSNILFSPDNDSSTATQFDEGGLRVNLGGDVEYRLFYREKNDLSAKIAVSNTQSFSDDFVQADPLTYTATLPYNLKGIYNKKGYKLGLTPGFESSYLDFDRSENLTNIVQTIILNTDLLVVMNENWFSSTNLDVRLDDSKIPGEENTDDDADATRVAIKKSEIIFLDSSKKSAFSPHFSYTINSAKGDDALYSRIEFGATYTAPYKKFKNTNWSTTLATYIQDFTSHSDNRKDTNLSLTLGLTKTLNDRWSWSNLVNYTSNSSSVEDSDYSKYSVTSTAVYSWGQ